VEKVWVRFKNSASQFMLQSPYRHEIAALPPAVRQIDDFPHTVGFVTYV
jgi:hypothetical protein